MNKKNIEKIVNRCEQILDLTNAKLSNEYFYQSLSLCVIDAVYSLGARYESTRHVVIKYCNYFNLQRIRKDKNNLPKKETQEPIENFLEKMQRLGVEKFAKEIFQNRQRTSTKNGILKAEAVLKFATVLKKYNINYLQDVPAVISNSNFDKNIRKIPGQRSGKSLKYFFMLSGSDDFVKPDRMILGFLKDTLQKNVLPEEAQYLLCEASKKLKPKYPNITPKVLDYTIWNYQRQR